MKHAPRGGPPQHGSSPDGGPRGSPALRCVWDRQRIGFTDDRQSRHLLPHAVACCPQSQCCWLAAPSISGCCVLAAVRSGPKFSPSNVTHAAPVEASISPGETRKMRWQVAEVRDCQPYNSPWRSSQQQQHGGSGLACCGNPSVSALTVCSGIERSTRPVSVEDAERGPEKERVQSRTRPRKAQRNKRASWRARAGPASMCVIRALRWIRQTAGWHGRFARGHLEPAHNQQPSAQRPAHT